MKIMYPKRQCSVCIEETWKGALLSTASETSPIPGGGFRGCHGTSSGGGLEKTRVSVFRQLDFGGAMRPYGGPGRARAWVSSEPSGGRGGLLNGRRILQLLKERLRGSRTR